MFLTKNAGSDSVAWFALSQVSYISRKTAGLAKCCHLPASQSALLPQHSSFTILLPSSFSSVSVIFEVLSCFLLSPPSIPQHHQPAARLCPISAILPFPLASLLSSCVPQVSSSASPEVHHPVLSHLLDARFSL